MFNTKFLYSRIIFSGCFYLGKKGNILALAIEGKAISHNPLTSTSYFIPININPDNK